MSYKKHSKKGFTLIEVIMVIAIIGFLIIVLMQNALRHLSRARDAERKTDIQKIKTAFEGYYDEHQTYPLDPDILNACDEAFEHYLKEIPCDPLDNSPYIYDPYPDGSAYRILSKLENSEDPVVKELACDGDNGCGYVGRPDYNYGTSVGRKVSDAAQTPEEPPVDPCEGHTRQNFICEDGSSGSGRCQSCGTASCPPGRVVYGCYESCVENSNCTELQ